jgi:transcriptional regulator with XRE-family HTH domain
VADPEKLFRARLEQLIRRKYPSLDRFWLDKDISKGYVSLVLRGRRSPSVRTLARLAKALGVELKAFFIFPDRGEKDRAMELLQTADADTIRRVVRLLEDEQR